jgi:phosphatidylinositol-3-phosphatase
LRALLFALGAFAVGAGCGGSAAQTGSVADAAPGGGPTAEPTGAAAPRVFIIAMENKDPSDIYGNVDDAPYINGTLLPRYAHATAFGDALPKLPSEPHYVWMEAGTNVFADHTFTSDLKPSAQNSTASRDHLVSQIAATGGKLSWMSYQEGIGAATGACPIDGEGFYHPRHNPFVFFKDVAGDPPSPDAPDCVAHHRDFEAFAADLASGNVASYNFITPDLCHDMHGSSGCPSANKIRMGDDWLAGFLPPLIDFMNAEGGVVFLTWEEAGRSGHMPFIAIGPDVKPGYAGAVPYTHSSMLKTVEEMLGLPILPTVADATSLDDLFLP